MLGAEGRKELKTRPRSKKYRYVMPLCKEVKAIVEAQKKPYPKCVSSSKVEHSVPTERRRFNTDLDAPIKKPKRKNIVPLNGKETV